MARQWVRSDDPLARYLAVRVFAAHFDPHDAVTLRGLLNDSYQFDETFSFSPWLTHNYAIRQAAADALKARGEAVPAATLSTPRTDLYRPFRKLSLVFWIMFPPLFFAVARRAHRLRRHLARPSLRTSLIAYGTFICLYCTLPAGLLWYRSEQVADDVIYAKNGLLFDATSLHGNLFIEAAVDWPGETSLVHFSIKNPGNLPAPTRQLNFTPFFGTYFLDSIRGNYWYGSNWTFYAGYDAVNSDSLGVGGGTSRVIRHPSVTLEIAYPYLIAIFIGLAGALQLISRAITIEQGWRRRYLANHGRCPNCTYDLRAHKRGELCPECGELWQR